MILMLHIIILEKILRQVGMFQERASGHVFKQMNKTVVKTFETQSLRASSYIPTKFKSSNVINVKNLKDNKCFLW